jgi:transketolase
MRTEISDLEEKANKIRREVIKMLATAHTWHGPSSMSPADLVTALYFHVMHVDPGNPSWEDRDRFVLSKGHACSLWYATLAEKGFFPKEELSNYRKPFSILQGHPDMTLTPGVEMSAGSLGHGLSAAVGMAMGGKLDGKHLRVYALLSDGEMQAGQTWEAGMAAAHYKLDNLTAIVDYNKLQATARVQDEMSIEPLADKWRAFGWHVIQIDGHNMEQILDAFLEAENVKGRPIMIIAHTIKGKGVSFMENAIDWHGKVVTEQDAKRALEELRGRRDR